MADGQAVEGDCQVSAGLSSSPMVRIGDANSQGELGDPCSVAGPGAELHRLAIARDGSLALGQVGVLIAESRQQLHVGPGLADQSELVVANRLAMGVNRGCLSGGTECARAGDVKRGLRQ